MALTNKLTAIADAIRAKTGKTDALTLDAMVTEIGSISGGGTGALVFDSEYNLTGTIEEVPNKLFYSPGNTYRSGIVDIIKSVNLSKATKIGSSAFSYNQAIKTIDLPACTTVEGSAFYGCTGLTTLSLPACTTVEGSAFYACTGLTTLSLPACTTVKGSAFYENWVLANVDLGLTTAIQQQTFYKCYSLKQVVIRKDDAVCTLSNTNAFTNCYHLYGTVNATYNPDGAKDCYIYVPDALVDTYKTTTNWLTIADQIKPLSELPTEA